MTYGNQYMMNDRLYIIPQDEETRISILNIDRKTKEDLRKNYKIHADHDWQSNTIANVTIENIIKSLALEIVHDQQAEPINFFNLFTSTVTVKRDEDAEKEGNINISFTHGEEAGKFIKDFVAGIEESDMVYPRLELLIYPDPSTRKLPDNPFGLSEAEAVRLAKIEKHTRLELSEKYSINITDTSASTATITYVFVKNIFRHLLEKIKLTNKSSASVNFNDNIEFHALVKADSFSLTMRPGMNAKLLIKSDATTESEELDDYDD